MDLMTGVQPVRKGPIRSQISELNHQWESVGKVNYEAVGESFYVQGKWPWQAFRGNMEDRRKEREQEDRTE